MVNKKDTLRIDGGNKVPKYFEVGKRDIGQVYFEPQDSYEVPRFQRNYSWEEGNVDEFWETVFADEPIFLGTVIFNVRRRSDERIIEIIDGQQRYLTIHILAAVVRDTSRRLFDEFEDSRFLDIAEGVTKQLLGKQDVYNKLEFEYYLRPGESLREFFLNYIQDYSNELRIDEFTKVKKDSEQDKVKRAYLMFEKLIDRELQKLELISQKQEFLIDLIRNRLRKHFFVCIEIADEDLAYEIFETVNARGVELNVADLVKNQIFRHVVGSDGIFEDKAKANWGELIETIDPTGLSLKEFLGYYWSSKYDYVAERKLYRTIREHFRDDNDRWQEFLEDLCRHANYLKLILTGDVQDLRDFLGDYGEAERCFASLRILRNLKAKTWAILYLCLFRLLETLPSGNRTLPLLLGKRWEVISKFTFVYFQLMGYPGNWYFSLICDFCGALVSATKIARDANFYSLLFKDKLFAAFDARLPRTFEEFQAGFSGLSYKSDTKSRIIIRYVLSAIETELGGKFDEGFDESKVSIEHILPQEPKDWGLTKKEIKPHVNLIGNLLLIGKRLNGALGNKPFAEKLVEFRKSQLNQVREFLDQVDNHQLNFELISDLKDFGCIHQRANSLAKIGYAIWVDQVRKGMGFATIPNNP